MTRSLTTRLTGLLASAVLLIATVGCGDAAGDSVEAAKPSASKGDIHLWGGCPRSRREFLAVKTGLDLAVRHRRLLEPD